MGVVIEFAVRDAAPAAQGLRRAGEGAKVVILPVIRIERYAESPSGGALPDRGTAQVRGRRRPRSRA
jgi:hypothetical protein